MTTITQETFLKDVENHEMTIIADTDFVRSIRFKQPNTTNRYFDITTWNGHLCISGDMGTYVFSRLPDMFTFFRNCKPNLGYWGEKLEAVSRFSGYKEFDTNLVEQSIKKRVDEICEEIEGYFDNLDKHEKEEYPTKEALEAAFREEVESYFECEDLGEYRFLAAIESFESSVITDLTLIYEGEYGWITTEKPSYQYVWVCHAIPWAIEQYDKFKSENESKDAE